MTTTTSLQQLDLFGPDAQQADDERAAWLARFTRAPWVAPWDCSGGLRKGESVSGWTCPACGVVEVNSHLLNLNHGYDPQIPGRTGGGGAFGASCSRLMLLASQEASRLAREAKAARR